VVVVLEPFVVVLVDEVLEVEFEPELELVVVEPDVLLLVVV